MILIYIYENYRAELYWSENPLEHNKSYVGQRGDSYKYLGFAKNKEEAMKMTYDFIDEYAQKFVNSIPFRKE